MQPAAGGRSRSAAGRAPGSRPAKLHGVSPPKMISVDYELIVDTDEDDRRLELLHTNARPDVPFPCCPAAATPPGYAPPRPVDPAQCRRGASGSSSKYRHRRNPCV